MGLVIVVVVKAFLENVVRQSLRPFAVEHLKSKDSRQNLGRETDLLFKEEVSNTVASILSSVPVLLSAFGHALVLER